MKGFNVGAIIPVRNLENVKPRRFNLIVRIHPEEPVSAYVIMPDSVKRVMDTTRGWFGTIIAAGESVKRMSGMIGVINSGTICMFDETVSVDDPHRCFDDDDGNRYVMFDIETVMGVLGPKKKIRMLGDRVLVRRPKVDDFRMIGKLYVPDTHKPQPVGGVVVGVGPGLPTESGRLAMDFKVGEFVMFPKFGATDIKIDGVDHVVIRQDKILGVVEGEHERIKWA